MIKLICVFVVLLGSLACEKSNAQNLIPNPGFEDLIKCPTKFYKDSSNIAQARGWFSVGHTGAELFNTCAGAFKETSVPKNFSGKCFPHQGLGYAGFLNYMNDMQIKLSAPLNPGWHYRVSLFVESPWDSAFYVPEDASYIRFFISESPTLAAYQELHREEAGRLKRNKDSLIYMHNHWMEVSAMYTAKGGEQYFAFGGFHNLPYFYRKADHNAYYFVDDISITPFGKQPPIASIPFTNKLEKGKALELQHIYFETGKSTLKPESFKELNQLALAMKKDTAAAITITGHTDNAGKEADNQTLSLARAEAVKAYLVSQNVASGRIICKGQGSARPVADNGVAGGRKRNRRVEISVN